MSPWDHFRLRWHDIPDGSGGTSACGDTRMHDEVVIAPGELRPEVVAAVLAHDVERVSAVLYTAMRLNGGPWRPVMSPHNRKRVGALINGWANPARHQK